MTVNAIVAILAAIGGVGGLVQLVKAIQAWRDGIRQREEAADERLYTRMEHDIEIMKIERAQDADYIRRLVQALGMAGIPIPPRVEEGPHPQPK